MDRQVFMNWSGGKDSALALHALMLEKTYQITGLLTTLNEQFDRVSMHGLRRELLEKQAEQLGLPLHQIKLPFNASMEQYGKLMKDQMDDFKQQGIDYAAFGDIFLEDLRAYREEQLAKAALKGVFPIWGKGTKQLIHEFVDAGFKAILICVNAQLLDNSFLGKEIDRDFLAVLPQGVDPCGENGEYHSFVYDGPIFKRPISFQKGEMISRSYGKDEDTGFDKEFLFLDLLPA